MVLAVDEPLDVAFGPLGLRWNGEVNFGHVGGLEEGVAAFRALF